jgi:putative transcriptional regulator
MAKSDKELEEMENGRDIWQEVLDGVREIQAGKGKTVSVTLPAAARVRKTSGLSQVEFAEILGVSVRTLQDWEQGRRKPSGAAATLLRIVEKHPTLLREAMAG